jgi:hypothetical protein
MKTASWMIFAATLAAFSASISAEDDPSVPAKYRNASPEIRAAVGLPPDPNAEPPLVDIDTLRMVAGSDGAHCAAVKVSAPVQFRNRTLAEIPDITEPGLRLANQLMSAGCFARAVRELQGVLRADPANVHANYVIARMAWMRLDTSEGERVLKKTLAKHKDFVSAKVLLAGIRFEQERLAESAALLDEVEQRSPTDLWIYMGRLRIEGLRSPSADLRTRLFEIMRSPSFPPNAREGAGLIAMQLPQTAKQYEEVLRARLDIDSSVGMACKAHELAFWLSESQQQFGEVIKLLESPRAKQGNCLGLQRNRTLLAQAYLMEAARISAGPSPANQHLLKRVDLLLNGDYTSVAAHAQNRPQYAQLRPFLTAYVHPEEEDEHGVTKLCHAINQLDVALVREHLEAGADPRGRCRDESLVGSLVHMAPSRTDDGRRAIMRALLEHGAPVTKENIESCRSRDNGNCHEVLLPEMEKYVRADK